jgi:hypothetical protein
MPSIPTRDTSLDDGCTCTAAIVGSIMPLPPGRNGNTDGINNPAVASSALRQVQDISASLAQTHENQQRALAAYNPVSQNMARQPQPKCPPEFDAEFQQPKLPYHDPNARMDQVSSLP